MFSFLAASFVVAFVGSLTVVTGLHLFFSKNIKKIEVLAIDTFWCARPPLSVLPLTTAALEVADVLSSMSAIEEDVVLSYNPLSLLVEPTDEAINFSFSDKLWFSGHRNVINQVPTTDAEAWTVRAPSFTRRVSSVRLCNW